MKPITDQVSLQRAADNVARSTTCAVCGTMKRREDGFCIDHWRCLPSELRQELCRNWTGWTSTRSRSWIKCFNWLMRDQREQEAKMEDGEL